MAEFQKLLETGCVTGISSFAQLIEDNKNKPDDVRFALQFDKIKTLLYAAKMLTTNKMIFGLVFPNILSDQIDKLSIDLDTIIQEITDMENYVLNKRKSELKTITDKLDEVLLGPDYAPGMEMMKKANEDFQQNSHKKPRLE